MTFTAELPPDNPVLAGRWFGPDAKAELSLETELARLLAAVHATLDEPARERRAPDLGAGRGVVAYSLAAEFLVLGVIAGFLRV